MKIKHYIIKNANIVDVINGRIIPNQCLEVENGHIGQMSEHLDARIPFIDAKGQYIMPGLINLHVHLFGNGVPKKSVSNKGKSQAKLLKFAQSPLGLLYLRFTALKSAKEELLGGATTIRSVGDFRYVDVYAREKIKQGHKIGPRMLVCGPALTCPNGHGAGTIAIACTSKDEFIKLIDENVAHNVDWIKITLTSGVMDALDANHPGDVRMSQEQVNWVCEYAHSKGLKVASHTECSDGVRMCLIGGVDTIEHSAKFDEDIKNRFKKSNSVVVTTISPALPSVKLPESYSKYSPEQIKACEIVSNNIIEGSKDALKNNVLVGMGTDAACPFSSQSGTWRELCYFTKYVGVEPKEALRIATIQNAKILGLDNKIGSIELGKSADLIISKDNPFENLKTLKKLSYVIIHGRIIKNPRPHRNKKMEEMLDTLI